MSVKQIGLRCDVDFGIGLARGVPYLLDVLKRHGMHGTFYVTMGPDGFRQHSNRLGSAAYRKRIRRMNPLGMIKAFGPWYLARQALGIKGTVGLSQPKVLRRVAAEGHELGVHGFDHYWWAENAFTAPGDLLKADMERAMTALKGATGHDAAAWASPNWRCSRALLELIDEYRFPYGADTRGGSPYFPEVDGYRARTPQLPISLPCLHEISDYLDTTDPETIRDEFLRHVRPGYNVWCIHDYYEGVLRRPMFESVVDALVSGGWTLVPIAALAGRLDRASVPVSRVTTARMPGGRGAVSCQQGTGTEITE
jgi:undecaprenyl phosphate-alpha-L-ara4FN deformylase